MTKDAVDEIIQNIENKISQKSATEENEEYDYLETISQTEYQAYNRINPRSQQEGLNIIDKTGVNGNIINYSLISNIVWSEGETITIISHNDVIKIKGKRLMRLVTLLQFKKVWYIREYNTSLPYPEKEPIIEQVEYHNLENIMQKINQEK